MAERLNPLSLIGASADPTLGDRLTQSAKATSDLQSGLAKIAQQNRAQLEAQRMAGQTQTNVAMIGKDVLPKSIAAQDPDAQGWFTNQKQAGIDLVNAQELLARYGAMEHGANVGFRPQVLPKGQHYTFGGPAGAGADTTKLGRFAPLGVLKARLAQPKPDTKAIRKIGTERIEEGIGTPGGLPTGALKKIKTKTSGEESVESKVVSKPLAENIVNDIVTSIWEKFPSIAKQYNLYDEKTNPTGNRVIEAYDLGNGKIRLILLDPKGDRHRGDIEI